MRYRCLDREFSVEHSDIYFKVIGQALQELWQFESTHANSRNLSAFLIQIQCSGLCGFKSERPYCFIMMDKSGIHYVSLNHFHCFTSLYGTKTEKKNTAKTENAQQNGYCNKACDICIHQKCTKL